MDQEKDSSSPLLESSHTDRRPYSSIGPMDQEKDSLSLHLESSHTDRHPYSSIGPMGQEKNTLSPLLESSRKDRRLYNSSGPMDQENDSLSPLLESSHTDRRPYTSSGLIVVDEEAFISPINYNEDNVMIYPHGGVLEAAEGNSKYFEKSHSRENLLMSDRSLAETTTTNMQTLMHLIKGNIGTGILALPVAVSHAGLWTGFAGILIIGAVAVHCMHMLINCSHKLSHRTGNVALDYADVMEICLKTGPRGLQRFSKMSRHVVNGLLIFTQFGFCCVYIVFVASNIEKTYDKVKKFLVVVNTYAIYYVCCHYALNCPDAQPPAAEFESAILVISHFHPDGPSLLVYEIIVTCALIPYVFVRDLKMLAPFSSFANILTITGLIITIQYIVQGLPNVSERPAFRSFSELPLFFGTAIFSVEGISLILPLENSMQNPEDFGGWSGVLNLGMVGTVCLYTAVGFYGYLKFGDDVEDSITLSLPEDNWLYLSVRLMFALAIFITYNVQFYVPIAIMWPSIRKRLRRKLFRNYGEYLFRLILVLVTFGFAAAIPHLDLLISLIGAFASSSLALILPAFIEVITLSVEGEHLPVYIVVKNVLIFLFGVVGCIIGTYTSMKAIIEAF